MDREDITLIRLMIGAGTFAVLLIVMLLFALFTEEVPTAEGQEIKMIESNPYYEIYVDKDTGVNYIVYSAIDKAAMQPRFNPDGSLYVSEVE